MADVNLLVYLLIEGEMSEIATAVYEADGAWVAPRLWRSEFRNVLALQLRSRRLSLPEAQELMADALVLMDDDLPEVDSNQVLQLAAQSKCTTYDVEYVALARMLGVSLVTADKQVLRAFPDTARTPHSLLK